MNNFEVETPILNGPYDEPKEHWWILEGQSADRRQGRRPASYWYRPQGRSEQEGGILIELRQVNIIRERIKNWREQNYPGVTRTTLDLLKYWTREGRQQRLFFAQVEAAETIIFLTEARADFRQGIEVKRDEPGEEAKAKGYTGFLRYACKMATGSGKTTVMGMLGAWSILNKVNDKGDARFSDVVLVVCPNVTIRSRLSELDPEQGEASLYRKRDLVPAHLMAQLCQGKVLIKNWHEFQPQVPQTGGDGGKVVKAGVAVETTETIRIGEKNDTKRGTRWLTRETLHQQIAQEIIEVAPGYDADIDTTIKIRSVRYVESDTALVNRVLRGVGGKQNILVFNDEAHHAYRIKTKLEEQEGLEYEDPDEEEEWKESKKEATIWVEGLDRLHKLRGINTCIDLSATPYYLGRVGQDANRPFPWVVSDFGLIDAIESGLVKIPQLAVQDTSGQEVPGYFNIWQWILQPGRLTASERGGKHAAPKPEAILKWSNTPIGMLGGRWRKTWEDWKATGQEPRPPVFILVCKNTALANVIFEWLANDVRPHGIPPSGLPEFKNTATAQNTIVVHSKVVDDSDGGASKSDEVRWMRFTLDTVGRMGWPRDRQGRDIMPEGFEELAKKMDRPVHPPGRDVRCIVSVGMLTEGWDCNTVTHIIGLRPFQSQLLCEQVVGRGLRRANYDIGEDGKLTEEVAEIFGVPFQVVPFKASGAGPAKDVQKKKHVRALPERRALAIKFPRVEGYVNEIRDRITVNWKNVPPLRLEPHKIPPEVTAKASIPSNNGRPSLMGPGKTHEITLREFREGHRVQQLVFQVAGQITKEYVHQSNGRLTAQTLFPQVSRAVERYINECVEVTTPADIKDLFMSPYYGWLVETLVENIRGDEQAGEPVELPLIERSRGPGRTDDVDFWTARETRETMRSHVNYVVADTKRWEQNAAYFLDRHNVVESWVKNAGLGLGIPYIHNGEQHEYVPDFIVKLKGEGQRHLILETKGYDELKEKKQAAAVRWCHAVNAGREYGEWNFKMVMKPDEVPLVLQQYV